MTRSPHIHAPHPAQGPDHEHFRWGRVGTSWCRLNPTPWARLSVYPERVTCPRCLDRIARDAEHRLSGSGKPCEHLNVVPISFTDGTARCRDCHRTISTRPSQKVRHGTNARLSINGELFTDLAGFTFLKP